MIPIIIVTPPEALKNPLILFNPIPGPSKVSSAQPRSWGDKNLEVRLNKLLFRFSSDLVIRGQLEEAIVGLTCFNS